MDRHIVCFTIPSFEVSLARLHEPALESRPVAIAPLHTPRALLQDVSREAEHEGLRVGMSIEYARRVCPALQVRSSNPRHLSHATQSVLSVVTRYAPVWEPVQAG